MASGFARSPILIGITGRRWFDLGDPDRDRAAAEAFKHRIALCLAVLDDKFKDIPKVLLTGAAIGADLLALRAALERSELWSAAVILPFSRDLFEEDFRPDADELLRRWQGLNRDAEARPAWLAGWETRHDAYRRELSDCLDNHPDRVLVRCLPGLRMADGRRAAAADLSRDTPGRDPAVRQAHYEQVGQWIAAASTVMLAVLGDDARPSAKATGGTARIVAVRRVGRPDAAGVAVAERSDVLRQHWSPVLRPPGRHVWLVGPAAGGAPGLPAAVLGPLGRWPASADAPADDPPLHGERHGHAEPARGPDALLGESLTTAAMFARFHRHATWYGARHRAERRIGSRHRAARLAKRLLAIGYYARSLWSTPPLKVSTAPQPPGEAIWEARNRLRWGQSRSKSMAKASFLATALLFLASLLAFEVFAKFAPHRPAILFGYVVCIAATGLLIVTATLRRWQPLSEDSRSISEMLRVQRAWWAAGLPNRVDREHLQGVSADLAPIRDATTTLLAWIWLRGGWPGDTPQHHDGTQAFDWPTVYGGAHRVRADRAPRSAAGWIGEQIAYFRKTGQAREDAAHRAEAGSWFVFVGAWWLAVLVLVWSASYAVKHAFAEISHLVRILAGDGTALPVSVAAALLLAAAAALPLGWCLRISTLHGREPTRIRRWIRTGLRPLPSALLIGAACMALAPALIETTTVPEESAAKYAALVSIALMIGATGAWRFLAEKLGFEAEALEYKDALARFRLAEEALAAETDEHGRPRDVARAQAIVHDLGRLALVENEAWLKSRRERPLTPLAG